MSDTAEETWIEVGRFRSRRETDQNALVLVARGINCRVIAHPNGIALYVVEPAVAVARRELAAYAAENRGPSRPKLPTRPLRDGIAGVLAAAAMLFFLQAAANTQAFGFDWLTAGEAQAGLITHGEWWRTLTALGLHADYGHLLSNLAAGSILAIFLAQFVGSGVAWLAILATGGVGNTANSLLQSADHTAIGASTAVFGAIGVFAALAVKYQATIWRTGLRRLAPLAAGVMLLAFLGIEGERIDIGAHVAGLASGIAIGAVLIAAGPTVLERRIVQRVCGAAAVAIFAVAWVAALLTG